MDQGTGWLELLFTELARIERGMFGCAGLELATLVLRYLLALGHSTMLWACGEEPQLGGGVRSGLKEQGVAAVMNWLMRTEAVVGSGNLREW